MEMDLSTILANESLQITVVNTEYKPLQEIREDETLLIRLTPEGRHVTIEKKMDQEIPADPTPSDWDTLEL